MGQVVLLGSDVDVAGVGLVDPRSGPQGHGVQGVGFAGGPHGFWFGDEQQGVGLGAELRDIEVGAGLADSGPQGVGTGGVS